MSLRFSVTLTLSLPTNVGRRYQKVVDMLLNEIRNTLEIEISKDCLPFWIRLVRCLWNEAGLQFRLEFLFLPLK